MNNGEIWPLNPETVSRLTSNSVVLAEKLDVDDDLLSWMGQTQCFVERQLAAIKRTKTPAQRSIELSDMLKRRSQLHFNSFIECLSKTQSHMIPYFTGKSNTYSIISDRTVCNSSSPSSRRHRLTTPSPNAVPYSKTNAVNRKPLIMLTMGHSILLSMRKHS